MPLDAVAVSKAASPAISGGLKGLKAWRRPARETTLFGIRIDRAIGDAGMCVFLANRWTRSVQVTCWGIVARKALPTTAKLPTLLMPDAGVVAPGAITWLADAYGCPRQGEPLWVAPGTEALLRVEHAARPPDHGGPKLVGLAEIGAFGTLIGRPKDRDWARSDVSLDACRCGHLHAQHGPRPKLIKMTVERHSGHCRAGNCTCRRYRHHARRVVDLDDARIV